MAQQVSEMQGDPRMARTPEPMAGPPGLQPAVENGPSCGECKHFGENACVKFGGAPVTRDMVCEAWEPVE